MIRRCCALSLRCYKSPVTFSDRQTDTQVLVEKDKGTAYVAVRGTSSMRDAFMDLDFWGTPFRGGFVHSGFQRCTQAVRDRVCDAVKHSGEVVLTGHSLGGAVSTLLALDVAETFPDKKVRHVTFGSPRVGSPVFADHFDAVVPFSHRFYMRGDPVTWLPGFMGFRHVGKPHRLAGIGHSLRRYQANL